MPLLTKVVLDALQTVECRHLLWTLICAWLAPCVVGRVLVLHLRGRVLRNGPWFVVSQGWFALRPLSHAAWLRRWLQASLFLAPFIPGRLTSWTLVNRAVCCWLAVHFFFDYSFVSKSQTDLFQEIWAGGAIQAKSTVLPKLNFFSEH